MSWRARLLDVAAWCLAVPLACFMLSTWFVVSVVLFAYRIVQAPQTWLLEAVRIARRRTDALKRPPAERLSWNRYVGYVRSCPGDTDRPVRPGGLR